MDLRYQQLEQETELEKQVSAGAYASEGFGRSTESVSKLDIVGQLSQNRVVALNRVVQLEESFKNAKTEAEFKSLSQQLASAQEVYNKQTEAARQRMTALSLKLSGAGQAADQKVNQLLGGRVKRGGKSFKINKPLINESNTLKTSIESIKPIIDMFNAPLNTITPLSSIPSLITQIKPLTA